MRVQSRRTDVFPTTWEIPVGVGLVWLLSAVLALPAGQGVAYAIRGEGFAWPGPQLGESLLGLFSGDPAQGLSEEFRASNPPVLLIYSSAIVLELALAFTALVGFAWWWRTIGPLAQFGMAPKHEVAAVLGRSQLMRRGTTIRPDLVGGGRR